MTSDRLFHCDLCTRLVSICRSCDRGNRYCGLCALPQRAGEGTGRPTAATRGGSGASGSIKNDSGATESDNG